MRSTLPPWLVGLALSGMCCQHTEVLEGFPETYAGVGLELKIEQGRPVVVRAIKGGPAHLAEVSPGDRIMEIDGVSTKGLNLGEVVVRLRGKPDSQVTLGVNRKGNRILFVVRRQALRKKGQDYAAER